MELNYLPNKEISFTTSQLMTREYTARNSVMLFLIKKMNSKLPKSMQELKKKKCQHKKNNKKKQFRKLKMILTSTSKLMIQKIYNLDLSMSQLYSMHLMFKFNSLMMHKYLIHLMYNFNILTTPKKSKMLKMTQMSN